MREPLCRYLLLISYNARQTKSPNHRSNNLSQWRRKLTKIWKFKGVIKKCNPDHLAPSDWYHCSLSTMNLSVQDLIRQKWVFGRCKNWRFQFQKWKVRCWENLQFSNFCRFSTDRIFMPYPCRASGSKKVAIDEIYFFSFKMAISVNPNGHFEEMGAWLQIL